MTKMNSTRMARLLGGTATALALVLGGALGAAWLAPAPANAAMGALPVSEALTLAVPVTLPSFADLVEKVSPAVVSVRVEEKMERQASDEGSEDQREMMRRFLEQFGMPVPPEGDGQGGGRPAEAMGSGFIIDAAGFIVTNNHVIEGAQKITVIFSNGKETEAKLVGTDEATDVALLKIESPEPLPYVEFADDTKVRVGDWVVAIGNPFGLSQTVTAGIISARGRNIGAGPYTDFLQIDAPINRGNSGGPAFDASGRVIGVNSAIYTPSGGSVGIGFAIPATLVKSVVGELKEKGSITRGWLGVQIQPVDADTAAAVGLPGEPRGALVSGVQPGSPAEKAGFKRGDLVLKAEGQDISDNRALSRIVASFKPGQAANFVVWRSGAELPLTAQIEVRKEENLRAENWGEGGSGPEPGAAVEGLKGVEVSEVTDEIRQAMGLSPDAKGVVITKVDGDSDAARKGLGVGALIVAVNDTEVSTAADIADAVKKAKEAGRTSVLLLVESGGQRAFIALDLG
jgi:serine protease Do